MEIKICQTSVRDLIEWSWTGWADWAGSEGCGWTWPLDPKTKACWATPEQSEWFSYMGSLVTSPPLCPIWLMVRRCILLDPTMADWAHPLLWPGDPVPVTQNRGDLLLNLVANKSIWGRCHLLHRVEDLWKEKPLFGWSGLAWTACLLPNYAGLECVVL